MHKFVGIVSVTLWLLLAGWGCSWAVDAPTPDGVTFAVQPDGGYLVTATGYTARVGGDGNMHSLLVNGVEFLDDQLPGSSGASYFDGKPILLKTLTLDQHLLQANDGQYSVKYLFEPASITIMLRHSNPKGAAFIAVGSAKIGFVEDLRVKTMAAAPADLHWSDVRVTMPTGEYLDVKGGSRIYGREVGRQIVECSNLSPNRDGMLKIIPGRGMPPAPALSQLTGLAIHMKEEDHLVPAGKEAGLVVEFTNNSNQQITSEVALRISSSTGQLVLNERKPLACPPHQAVELNWGINPGGSDFYAANCSVNLDGTLEFVQTHFGYDVASIHLTAEKPADFSNYWERAALEARTSVVELPKPPKVDLKRSTSTVLVYEVGIQVDGVEQFSGWLSIPKFPGRYPGLLVLPSDRVRAIGPNPALADCGFVVLSIEPTGQSVRGPLNPIIALASKEPAKPDKFGMRAVVVRCLEAVTALSKAPMVDPNRLAVTGAGLGGGLSLLLAALDDRIQAVAPDVPYYCNIGAPVGEDDWPYLELVDFLQQNPEQRSAVLKTLQYFDVANFVPAVNCPALISLGINDSYSLPKNIVSIVNQLPGPHALQVYIAGHEGGGVQHWQAKMRWLTSVLGGPSLLMPELPAPAKPADPVPSTVTPSAPPTAPSIPPAANTPAIPPAGVEHPAGKPEKATPPASPALPTAGETKTP